MRLVVTTSLWIEVIFQANIDKFSEMLHHRWSAEVLKDCLWSDWNLLGIKHLNSMNVVAGYRLRRQSLLYTLADNRQKALPNTIPLR